MRKLLNNPFVSGGLALAAIALVATSLMDDKDSKRPISNAASADYMETDDDYGQSHETEAPTTSTSATASSFDAQAILALATQTAARNLFARPAQSVVANTDAEPREQTLATATLQVKGVWVQGGLRYVVIGDKTLRPGQSLDRVVVERIETQGVWIAHDGQSHFIKPGESWSYQYPVPPQVARN